MFSNFFNFFILRPGVRDAAEWASYHHTISAVTTDRHSVATKPIFRGDKLKFCGHALSPRKFFSRPPRSGFRGDKPW